MICTTFDERQADIWENTPRWEVILDDGTKVYQDDYSSEISAWERLGKYCKENNRKIEHFKCGFRDNVVCLPSGKEGYFFKKIARGYLYGSTRQLFLVGYLEGETIKCQKYGVPEFILEEELDREIDPEDVSLIR